MAKPSAKPQPGKPPSKHSRAARRATSPSIDVDKSLKRAQPPAEAKPLGLHHGAGITKRKSKGKHLSHAQRIRRERGIARAEAVTEQLGVKVKKSLSREKVAKGRRNAWEDINEGAGDTARARKKAEAGADCDDGGVDSIEMPEVEVLTPSEPDALDFVDSLSPEGQNKDFPEKKATAADEVDVW